MKAVRIHEHGGPQVLKIEEVATPELKAGHALVRLKACGLNHLDLWVRKGVPGHTFPLPIIPGCDGSGVIEALGDGISGWEKGDDVLIAPGFSCGACAHCLRGDDNLCQHYGIFGETRDGTCAEFVLVPAANLLKKPANLSFEEAASMPLAFLTAWHMLVEKARVAPGEDVLIHAAGSGVSVAALQICKLFGARVFVTSSSDEKLEKAKALGADEGINYSSQDFSREIKTFTGKRGVDIVVDHVGEATWEKSIASLAKGGRLVSCGATSGFDLRTDARRFFFLSLTLYGSTMGSRSELHTVLKLAEQGRLKPVVDSILPWTDVSKAHEKLERREAFGKVVLSVA